MTPPNRILDHARAYHDRTKHAPDRLVGGSLDWSNRPRTQKRYLGLPARPLPLDLAPVTMPALDAIAQPPNDRTSPRTPTAADLARVLYLTGGITKHLVRGGASVPFRAAPCTGALYHVEMYVVAGDLPDLDAGIYHAAIDPLALVQLRSGDFREVLSRASGDHPALRRAGVAVVFTTTYWRNAWKYRQRMYRHAFWDLGTMLANALAAAFAEGLPAQVLLGFADAPVNDLLALDADREVALAIVPLGQGSAAPPAPPVEPRRFEIEQYSRREVDYPEIRAMHAASSLADGAEAAAWRDAAWSEPAGCAEAEEPGGPPVPLQPILAAALPRDPLRRVIRRRGSTRRFAREPITFAQLSTILDRATRGVPADFVRPGEMLADLYVIAHAVEGLAPGAYAFDRARRALLRLKPGEFRDEAGYLALGQHLAADAAANVYSLTALGPVLGRLGNRGYRAAQLEGGITGGRMYLAAYALGIGATGLTFFDDPVTQFFLPHAAGKSVMFLTALGKKAS